MDANEMMALLNKFHDSNYHVDEVAYQTAIQFVEQNPYHLFDRKNMNGHFSASGFAFENGKMWFIRHPYLHTILLPAGHVEPGESPLHTAQREYLEETGFTVEPLNDELNGLRDLNIISIPANPIKNEGSHIHIDLRYHLRLTDTFRQPAELQTYLLKPSEAPDEFKPYFQYYQ